VIAKNSGSQYRALDAQHLADEEQGDVDDGLSTSLGGITLDKSRQGSVGSVELMPSGESTVTKHMKLETCVQCDDDSLFENLSSHRL
jgi:hypothetical protein